MSKITWHIIVKAHAKPNSVKTTNIVSPKPPYSLYPYP